MVDLLAASASVCVYFARDPGPAGGYRIDLKSEVRQCPVRVDFPPGSTTCSARL